MELAPSSEPWTDAVPWARPWRRQVPGRPPAAVPRVVRPPTASDPEHEAAWIEAITEFRVACEALTRIDADADAWLEALARQDVFRARRKLRRAQEALSGTAVDIPWSSV
jgi:hypothetical protein